MIGGGGSDVMGVFRERWRNVKMMHREKRDVMTVMQQELEMVKDCYC